MIKVTRFESDKLNLMFEQSEKGEWSVYSITDSVTECMANEFISDLKRSLEIIEWQKEK